MKTLIKITWIILVIIAFGCSKQSEFPKLTGTYLGQKTPEDKPEIFAPGIISTGLEEVLCTFTPNGEEIIFNIIYTKPHSPKIHSVLVRSYIKNGAWTYPEVVNFSGDQYVYTYPFISYNGEELYFQSDMPTGDPQLSDTYNIWRCKRVNDSWSNPEPLPQPINGRGDVSGPSMSIKGEFYYTLMSGKPELDGICKSIYSNGIFMEPERLPESVNVREGSFDGVISPDGNYYLVNVYNMKDGYGKTDLYVSFKDDKGQWKALKNLGPIINTKFNEGSARISSDGQFIFYSGYLENYNYFSNSPSYRSILNSHTKPQAGNSDIYWVDAKVINDLKICVEIYKR